MSADDHQGGPFWHTVHLAEFEAAVDDAARALNVWPDGKRDPSLRAVIADAFDRGVEIGRAAR